MKNIINNCKPTGLDLMWKYNLTSSFNLNCLKNYKTFGMAATMFVLLLHSCTTVKAYEENKLNDAEMVLGNRPIEKTELSFQSYREGSSGANAGKVGGGCGCN